MKKLWLVSTTITTVVAAEDEAECREVLVDQATEILSGNECFVIEATPLVTPLPHWPSSWTPWSNDPDERTLGEWMADDRR